MRAFVLGNSIELLDHNLDLLKGEVVFGTNALPLFRPDIITHYVCADMVMGLIPEVRSLVNKDCTKYYSRIVWNTIYHEDNVNVFDTNDNFGFDISDTNVYLGKTVCFAALQIAAALGYNPIYLLGINLDGPKIPHYEQFQNILKMKNLRCPTDDKNIGPSNISDTADYMNKSFMLARHHLSKAGIEVFNISKGGILKAFPRKSFEEVLKQ